MSKAPAYLLMMAAALQLTACADHPPQPDWQMNAHDAMQRSLHAYLRGDSRIEAQEFANARGEISRTGRADLLARAELARCAGRVASLVMEDCTGFTALRSDATPADQAYAAYLAGQASMQTLALLPEQHRAVAQALAQGKALDAAQLQAVADPLARLVAAGVLLRSQTLTPAQVTLAIDTASAQGWRRPLLAWLNVQLQLTSDPTQQAQTRRRMAVVLGDGTPASAASAP